MEKKILVAFASKYGATEEIAKRIGQVLEAAKLPVDVRPVDQVSDVASYIAVVLGSAVYAGQWLDEAASFLKSNERALGCCPVWLFSSGPTGTGDPGTLMNGWHFPAALQPIADRIHPRDIAFFHGSLDLQRINFAEKLIVNVMRIPTGDYRNWNKVQNWGTQIASHFTESGPTVISLYKA
jgi:menaquinone-dependent protoporphyrinogen oxidase